MGTIKNDIVTFFLPQYPDQEALLKPFLYGFDVSYAEKKTLNNTTLYVYLLKPEEYVSDAVSVGLN